MKLKKGFAIAQAAMLMLTLVMMSFPVSARADQEDQNQQQNVEQQNQNNQQENDDDDQDNDGEDHQNEGHNGTLIVHKVIVGNPNASPSSFSYTVKKHHSQSTLTSSAFDVSGQNSMTVHAGHYDVTETPADHYTTSYDNCSNVNVHKNQTATCTITNTYVPPAPVEVSNSCVAPSTLDQSGQREIGNSPDGANAQLQTIMNTAGYSVTVGTDQTNTQVWTGSGNTVHFSAKFLSKFAGDKHVFGYFANGTTTFTPVFKDDASIGGVYSAVPVDGTQTFDVTNVSDVVFAIVDVTAGKTYATKSSLNDGGVQHTVVYNPSSNTYAIGFEDQNLGDHDYNDLDVEVKVTGCENPNQITVVATKIVCDNESDLPNAMGSSHTTDANTASDWINGNADKHIAAHPSCHLQKDWQFEWGNQSATDQGRDFVGPAVSGYTTSGLTAANGTVSMNIPLAGLSEVHLREVLKDGYIPFTYDSAHQSDADNVSAEFSCSNDGLHYDNFDFIRNPVAGNTYYCVAWNVAKVVPQCTTEGNILSNGGFESPVVSGGWNIVPSGTAGLSWLVSWINPTGAPATANAEFQAGVNGWLAHGGSQYAELDSDYFGPSNAGQGHPAVSMSQTVPTTPGVKYTFSFWFSPRPDQGSGENMADATANGTVIGSTAAVAGNGTQTQWTQYSFDFTATTTSTTFALRDAAGNPNDSLGTFVDDASVSCVPDETPTCPDGQHFNSDHICVPDVQECNADATQTLLSSDQGEGELITAALTHGAAKLVASPNGAWFAPALGDGLWIWKDTFTSDTDAQNPTSQTFERNFKILGTPHDATLTLAADNTYDVKVNGDEICSNLGEFNYGATVDCTIPAGDQVSGWNTLDITVTNMPIEGSTGASNPAGLSYKLVTHDNQCDVPENPDNGTVVIVKETTGGDGSFDFDLSGEAGYDADVTTSDGHGSTEVSVVPGDYNLTESVLSGWHLDSVSCEYDEESAGNSIPNGEAISLKAGDTVTCTFHNTKTTDDTTPSFTNGTTGSGGKKHSNGGGEVLGATSCSPLLTDYLKLGWKNNVDQVSKLQQFLNEHLGLTLPTTGFFGQMTYNAVKQFQKQYGNDVLHPWVGLPGSGISGDDTPTGYVYQTTRWKINNIFCPGSEAFPTVLN